MRNFLDRVLITTDHIEDFLDMGVIGSGRQICEKVSNLEQVVSGAL
jgi:hypothetical protein